MKVMNQHRGEVGGEDGKGRENIHRRLLRAASSPRFLLDLASVKAEQSVG
jgi:hypothetical protein